MRKRNWLAGPIAVALLFALLGSSSDAPERKGPAYLLIRGGDLEAPILVHHGGRDVGPSDSPLMRVLMSLGSVTDPAPPPETSRYYEVLEFWASPDVPWPGLDGRPEEPLDPATARAISRIYPDEPGGPVWNQYVDPGNFRGPRVESSKPYRPIDDRGAELLRSLGLTFGQ